MCARDARWFSCYDFGMLKKLRTATALSLYGLLLLGSGCNALWWAFLEPKPDCESETGNCELPDGGVAEEAWNQKYSVCNINGFCWQNPYPISPATDLYGVWAQDPNNVWIVGSGGVILNWNGEKWTRQGQALTITGELRSIWGLTTGNALRLWAVGDLTPAKTNGVLVLGDGKSWSQTTHPATGLRDVWGPDVNNVRVVGYGKSISRLTGSNWIDESPTNPAPDLKGIRGFDVNSMRAVGTGACILKWNGTSWASETCAGGSEYRSLWAADANNVWIVGQAGAIQRWNGAAWNAETSSASIELRRVWGTDASHVWAVGYVQNLKSTVLFRNQTQWVEQNPGVSTELEGVFGTSSNDVYVVGKGATILHSQNATDPNGWKPLNGSASTGKLNAVWGASPAHVWAIGDGGEILKWDGKEWKKQVSGTTANLYGIYGTSKDNVVAVGASGTILRWNGTNWVSQDSGTANDLRGVWGTAPDNIWAVGRDGIMLQWTGSKWASSGNSAKTFYAIWGPNDKLMWAVGDSGLIYKWSVGMGWASDGLSYTANFSSVSGHFNGATGKLWIVGTDGTNGIGVSADIPESGTISWGNLKTWNNMSALTGVFGSTGRVWGVGTPKTPNTMNVVNWNGENLVPLDSGTSATLRGIWGLSADQFWVVGDTGSILYHPNVSLDKLGSRKADMGFTAAE